MEDKFGKVLMLMIFAILLIGTVAAADWDNIKSYNKSSQTITIKSSILWIYPLDTVATIQLNTPTNYFVGQGYQKVAEMNFTTYENFKNYTSNIDLINVRDGSKITRQLDFKYKTLDNYSVDDYICKGVADAKNGTIFPDCSVSGSHMEQRVVWKDLNEYAWKSGEPVTIGIFTNVEKGDHIEWVFTDMFGQKLDEWSTWTQSLNVDLIYYWSFDETTGTNLVENVSKVNNFTAQNGAVVGSSGKIGNAVLYDGSNDYANTVAALDIDNSSISYNFWYYSYSLASIENPMSNYNYNGHSNGFQLQELTNTSWMNMYAGDGSTTGNAAAHVWVNGTWTMWTITSNTTHVNLYADGSLIKTTAFTYHPDADAVLTIANDMVNTGRNWNGKIDELGIWQRELSSAEVTQLWNGGNGLAYSNIPNVLSVYSVAPANYTNTTNSTIYFEANVTGNSGILINNVSLLIDGVINQTNTSGLNGTYTFNSGVSEGDHNWTVIAYGDDDAQYNSSNGTMFFGIDFSPPNVSSTNLTNFTTYSFPVNSTWRYNVTDAHLSLCYYNTTDSASYTVVTCNSTIDTTWNTEGTKTVQYCANDTLGFETCNTALVVITYVNYTQSDNPDPTGEGNTVTYTFNVTVPSGIGTTTATLMLNGSVYSADTITSNSTAYEFVKDIAIPDGWGTTTGNNVSWFWNYTISGITTNASSSSENTTVYSVAIDDCSSYGDHILNLTLEDENTGQILFPPTYNGSNIQIDLTIYSLTNASLTWTYANSWVNDTDGNVSVCIPNGVLTSSEYGLNFTIGYVSDNYAQEFYFLDAGVLNSSNFFNTLTNRSIVLYDLPLSDSTTFLFVFTDVDNLNVPNSLVHTFRKYIGEGIFKEVERSKEDNNGQTHIHLIEEDAIYYFKVTLNGDLLYTSDTYNAKCLSSPCEIDLTASQSTVGLVDTGYFDLLNGSASISSDKTTRNVTLTFSLTDPQTINLSVYNYSNDPSTIALQGSSQTLSTGGTLTVHVPLAAGNQTYFAVISQNGEQLVSEWVDFNDSGSDYFGSTGIFMAVLLLITLLLMAATEGEGTLIFGIFALIVIGMLQLVHLSYYAIVGVSCGILIVVFKLVRRRRG